MWTKWDIQWWIQAKARVRCQVVVHTWNTSHQVLGDHLSIEYQERQGEQYWTRGENPVYCVWWRNTEQNAQFRIEGIKEKQLGWVASQCDINDVWNQRIDLIGKIRREYQTNTIEWMGMMVIEGIFLWAELHTHHPTNSYHSPGFLQ